MLNGEENDRLSLRKRRKGDEDSPTQRAFVIASLQILPCSMLCCYAKTVTFMERREVNQKNTSRRRSNFKLYTSPIEFHFKFGLVLVSINKELLTITSWFCTFRPFAPSCVPATFSTPSFPTPDYILVPFPEDLSD